MNAPAPGEAGRQSDVILARLTRLHPKLIDLSLGRMERLLAALGNPERRLPPVIHVAGTNGKGSTVALLRAMAEAAGLSVHVYTSPHLVRFHERIRLAGSLVTEAALADLLDRCERANGEAPITFFEITTAAAFLAFSEVPADLVLLEVGLGGRLDATNVIAGPLAAAITPVSLDHQEFLGDTIAKIAAEKAGIAKAGRPLFVGPQHVDGEATIRAAAAAVGAPLRMAGRDWRVERVGECLRFQDADGSADFPLPVLPGPHQIVNAGLALAVARAVGPGLGIHKAAMARGLETAEWPARMQRLRRGPLVAALPPGAELWLDGGHNPAAGEAIAAALDPLDRDDPRPLRLVAGMLGTKDARGFFRALSGLGAPVTAVPIPGEANAAPAAALVTAARAEGIVADEAEGVEAAVAAIAARHAAEGGPPPRVVICGSLYLAGRVLSDNG